MRQLGKTPRPMASPELERPVRRDNS